MTELGQADEGRKPLRSLLKLTKPLAICIYINRSVGGKKEREEGERKRREN